MVFVEERGGVSSAGIWVVESAVSVVGVFCGDDIFRSSRFDEEDVSAAADQDNYETREDFKF